MFYIFADKLLFSCINESLRWIYVLFKFLSKQRFRSMKKRLICYHLIYQQN